MVLKKGSRYEKVRVYTHVDPKRGVNSLFKRRRPLIFPPDSEIIRHMVIEGETLDYLAYEYLGDARLWWVILELNSKYLTPYDINIGDIILVPTISAYRKAVQQYGL